MDALVFLAQTSPAEKTNLAEKTAADLSWAGGRVSFLLVAAVVLGIGIWLILPAGGRWRRALGSLVALLGLALLSCPFLMLGRWDSQILFWLLAAITVISALATISARSPVYSAIWFALALLGTAGLFLIQDAQFLSVATIIVYAGAILVTFLFLLMLAQPQGNAFYDRISWGGLAPLLACGCGTLIFFGLAQVLLEMPALSAAEPTARGDHMALLGGHLFSRHLISVEVAGTLLLVALVGAIAIVIHTQDALPQDSRHHDSRKSAATSAPQGREGDAGNG